LLSTALLHSVWKSETKSLLDNADLYPRWIILDSSFPLTPLSNRNSSCPPMAPENRPSDSTFWGSKSPSHLRWPSNLENSDVHPNCLAIMIPPAVRIRAPPVSCRNVSVSPGGSFMLFPHPSYLYAQLRSPMSCIAIVTSEWGVTFTNGHCLLAFPQWHEYVVERACWLRFCLGRVNLPHYPRTWEMRWDAVLEWTTCLMGFNQVAK
jgi:hypothetical protein